MHAPDTIDAAVHENNRKAAQKTPLIRAQNMVSSALRLSPAGVPPMWAPINSLQGTAQGASTRPPMIHGPLGKAK